MIEMTWNILEITQDNLYISLNKEFRENLFALAINKAGSNRKLAKILKSHISSIILRKTGTASCPLSSVKFLFNWLEINENELLKNIDGIGTGNRGGIRVRNPKLVICFNESLSRLLGHIYADGSVHKNMVISYTNQNPTLIEEFECLVRDVFGQVSIYRSYRSRDRTINVYLPKLIGLVLSSCIKNFKEKEIPIELFRLHPNLAPHFLASFFDDDGCVKVRSKELTIVQKNKKLLEGIRFLFLLTGIKTSEVMIFKKYDKIYWILRISRRKNFIKFRKTIKISHPKKKKRIEDLLNSYKSKFEKYELEEAIIKKLGVTTGETATSLADQLNIKSTTVCKTLTRLKNKKILKSSKIKLINKNGDKYQINSWCLK